MSEYSAEQKLQCLMLCESSRLAELLMYTEAKEISKINCLGTEAEIVMKTKVFDFSSNFL